MIFLAVSNDEWGGLFSLKHTKTPGLVVGINRGAQGAKAGVFLLADQFQIVGHVAELDDAQFITGPDVDDGLAFVVFADLSDDPVPSLVLDDGTFFYGDLHGSFG
jgi:hypothetical protein